MSKLNRFWRNWIRYTFIGSIRRIWSLSIIGKAKKFRLWRFRCLIHNSKIIIWFMFMLDEDRRNKILLSICQMKILNRIRWVGLIITLLRAILMLLIAIIMLWNRISRILRKFRVKSLRRLRLILRIWSKSLFRLEAVIRAVNRLF